MAIPTFAIVANGFADGPPAKPLREFLVAQGAGVVTIFHPLTPEQGTRHVIATYEGGEQVDEHTVRLPLRPPLSFLLDPLVPLLPQRVDGWFGFNPLACGRGLVAHRLGRARSVVLWSVDFVPDRFGRGTLATRVYDRLDRLCCMRADGRVELSESARDGRNRRHGLPPDAPTAHVVPMGAWTDDVATTQPDGFRARRVVYLGHLVPRQGVETLLEAMALLVGRGEEISAEIIGGGPLEASLREQGKTMALDEVVHFHGFVPDHREVERILAGSSIAVAPYKPGDDNFTRYADPGKLKAYLAAGLPIVLTNVPPNAGELAQHAGAHVVDYDAAAIADAVSQGLASPDAWRDRRRSALAYAARFDWATLLSDVLEKLGVDPAARSGLG